MMDCCAYETQTKNTLADPSYLKIIRHHQPYQSSLPWFDLRVFYVRISNFEVDDSTPEYLSLNHIPLSPNTLLEVNGTRTSFNSDGASCLLRRDRVDKKSEEATFVGTDSIRLTGSVKFEVLNGDQLILSGVLDLTNGSGCTNGESIGNAYGKWKLNCEAETTAGAGFLRQKHSNGGLELPSLPSIEVYVAGRFSGTPIILTKTLQLGHRKRNNRKKGMLDSIPENEDSGSNKDVPSDLDVQAGEYSTDCKLENEENHMYWDSDYMEGEDGELSWFNAGVRVGVGLGLGICLGVGIGVGLLVRTYHTTTRNFKRRLL